MFFITLFSAIVAEPEVCRRRGVINARIDNTCVDFEKERAVEDE